MTKTISQKDFDLMVRMAQPKLPPKNAATDRTAAVVARVNANAKFRAQEIIDDMKRTFEGAPTRA